MWERADSQQKEQHKGPKRSWRNSIFIQAKFTNGDSLLPWAYFRHLFRHLCQTRSGDCIANIQGAVFAHSHGHLKRPMCLQLSNDFTTEFRFEELVSCKSCWKRILRQAKSLAYRTFQDCLAQTACFQTVGKCKNSIRSPNRPHQLGQLLVKLVLHSKRLPTAKPW